MEIPNWFNDARFVLFIIALIYIIYVHFKYVAPIENSSKDYKETIRCMSIESIKPVIENKIRAAVRNYVKENKGMLTDSSIENIRKEIKEKVIDAATEKISNEFIFEDLPKEST